MSSNVLGDFMFLGFQKASFSHLLDFSATLLICILIKTNTICRFM